jgi:hypothetical protein
MNLVEKILKKLNPYRRIIVSLLLIGLLVSTIYALEFETSAQAEKNDILNPRTSSISLEKAETNQDSKTNSAENDRKSQTKTTPSSEKEDNRKTVTKKEELPTKKQVFKAEPIEKEEVKPKAKIVVASGPAIGSYQMTLPEEKSLTGLELMKLARDNHGLNFEYSGSGAMAFVSSIGGLENVVSDREGCSWSGSSWMLYYNDRLSMVGIGSIKINNQDKLTWNYEDYCY